MKIIKTLLPALLLLWTLLIVSCKSERVIYKAPLKEIGYTFLLNQLEAHELKFDSFKARVTIRFINKSKKSVLNGQIRIKKDSLIWISLAPALGLEMARLMITPDSIHVIDRVHHQYFAESYSFVENYLNSAVDFDMLQALLIGNDFSFFEEAQWKASIDGGLYKLATANRTKLKKYNYSHEEFAIPIQNTWLDPNTFKIKKIMVKEAVSERSKKLVATYDKFFIIDKQLLPLNVWFDIRAEENFDVMVDYSKIDLNNNIVFPFRVSSNYERIYPFSQ
jgi:hypothetical protein